MNKDVLETVWSGLNKKFSHTIKTYDGTVADFIKTYSPNVHLVGRVFFHMVENKANDYPFAFLATYSTRLGKQGKSKHLPLKYALEEYGKDSDKLLELLATVHIAAKQRALIAQLLETGEMLPPACLVRRGGTFVFKANTDL